MRLPMILTFNVGSIISHLVHLIIGYVWLGWPGVGLVVISAVSIQTKSIKYTFKRS